MKTTDFQLVFNFKQTCAVTVLMDSMVYGNGTYTMMAKPTRALMIHFFNNINNIISVKTDAWCCAPVIYVEDCFIFLMIIICTLGLKKLLGMM